MCTNNCMHIILWYAYKYLYTCWTQNIHYIYIYIYIYTSTQYVIIGLYILLFSICSMELTFEISGCFEKREEILWYMVTQSAAIALESLSLCILQWCKIAWLQRIIYKLLETYSHSQAPLWTKCNQRYREYQRMSKVRFILALPAASSTPWPKWNHLPAATVTLTAWRDRHRLKVPLPQCNSSVTRCLQRSQSEENGKMN